MAAGDGNGERAAPKVKPRSKKPAAGHQHVEDHGDRFFADVQETADGKRVKQLEIKKVRYDWVYLLIEGDNPLLTNRFGDKARQEIIDKLSGKAEATRKKPPRDPNQEVLEATYVFRPDGSEPDRALLAGLTLEEVKAKGYKFGFRAVGLKKAMVMAGWRFGNGPTTKQLLGFFYVHGPLTGFLEILTPDAPSRGADPVTIQGRRGSATIAFRPYYQGRTEQAPGWRMVVPIRFNPSLITAEQLIDLVNMAGQGVSIGSWRVENGGDKGVFTVLPGQIHYAEDTRAFNFGLYQTLQTKARLSHFPSDS